MRVKVETIETPPIKPDDFRVWIELHTPIGEDGSARFTAWWTGFRIGNGPMIRDGAIHAQVYYANVEQLKARHEYGTVMWKEEQ